jgi:hypothetical protein
LASKRKAMLLALQGVCRFSISASGIGLAVTVAKVQAKIGAKRMLKTWYLFERIVMLLACCETDDEAFVVL